jgi:F0F1-type ATP synthase epsilon subunit
MAELFDLVIRTPHATVFEDRVRALRVPTETGHVGLRPRGEPIVLAVEPGLIIMRLIEKLRFAATAGGLLESDRTRCTLYTPIAALGDSESEMLDALERMLSTPGGELMARRQLAELEQRIVRELRRRPVVAGMPRGGRA